MWPNSNSQSYYNDQPNNQPHYPRNYNNQDLNQQFGMQRDHVQSQQAAAYLQHKQQQQQQQQMYVEQHQQQYLSRLHQTVPRQNHQMQEQASMGYQHVPRNFMFNVNASEFVPRDQNGAYQQSYQNPYYDYTQPSHGYQDPTPFMGSSNMMYQNFPDDPMSLDVFAQFGQQTQQYIPSPELYEMISKCKAPELLSEIQVGCEQLLSEVEDDSSTWITAIRQRFENPSMDDDTKSVGVRLVVEMSYSMKPVVHGTDPQYTFACLLQTLCRDIPNFVGTILLPVLEQYYKHRNLLSNEDRVFLAVFFAELFIKVTLDNGSRIGKLGEALCDQLEDIVKFAPTDDIMKSLMRVFKISGAELDDSPNLRDKVNAILTRMGGYAIGAQKLSETVKAQTLSLIECRQRGWDRAPISREATSSDKYQNEDDTDESFELSEAERNFLESQLDMLEDKEDRNGYEEPDEQEVFKEFGKFVKEELERNEDQKTADMMMKLQVGEESNESAENAEESSSTST